MTLTVSDAAYADPQSHTIGCIVDGLPGLTGAHAYLAVDGDPTSQALFNDLVAEKYGAVAPYVAPVVPLSSLAAQATAAVNQAASSVVSAVMPDAAHQAAFTNAAAILAGTGGAAPTSGPLAVAFAALATAYGKSPADFAAVILGAQAISMTLAAATATFSTAADAATTTDALNAALAAFEASIASAVSAFNLTAPAPITAPAAIIIVGLNG